MQASSGSSSSDGSSEEPMQTSSVCEYTKQLSESAELIVKPDLFQNSSVLITKIKNNGTKRKIFLNQKQWTSLNRLVPKIADAPHAARLKVVLSFYRDVRYVGLCIDTPKGTFSVFLTRDEWTRMMADVRTVDAAMKTVQQRKVAPKRPSSLNVMTMDLTEPTVKLYRWSWYEGEREAATDSTVGYFTQKACLEAASIGRAQLESGDAAELMITTRDVDTWSNSQELMDAIVSYLCWHLVIERRKKVTCHGCLIDHPSQKQHMSLGGCLGTLQEALSNGEFNHVYEFELDVEGAEYVYCHTVEDLNLGWTAVPHPSKTAAEDYFEETVPLLELQGRPYQDLFLYHWIAYTRKQQQQQQELSSEATADVSSNSSSSSSSGALRRKEKKKAA